MREPRLLVVALLAAVAVPLALAVTACGKERQQKPKGPGLRVGLVANTLDYGADVAEEQRRARSSGAGWLREEFRWPEVEPEPGLRRWEKIDRMMVAAARNRLRVLPLLVGTPRWAGPERFGIPRRTRPFAAFTADVARRYGPGGSFWRSHRDLDASLAPRVYEVWNEPYYPQFSGGRVTPGLYARLFRAAARAGRRANRHTRYLLAADTTYPAHDGEHPDWIAAMRRAVPDLHRWTHGLAIHPYSGDFAPRQYTPGTSRGQFLRIREIRRAWGRRTRLWATELGWSTCPGGERCVTEAEQARYLADVFRVARRERLEAIFVYHLRDHGDDDPADRERWFGLRRRDGSAKPAWDVLRRVTGAAARGAGDDAWRQR